MYRFICKRIIIFILTVIYLYIFIRDNNMGALYRYMLNETNFSPKHYSAADRIIPYSTYYLRLYLFWFRPFTFTGKIHYYIIVTILFVPFYLNIYINSNAMKRRYLLILPIIKIYIKARYYFISAGSPEKCYNVYPLNSKYVFYYT